MKLLFVHQNFPAQFKHLSASFAADQNNTVVAILTSGIDGTHLAGESLIRKISTGQTETKYEVYWKGVKLVQYKISRDLSDDIHPWISSVEAKAIHGEAVFRSACKLRDEGFEPDAIIAHPGWGESLFLKDVWPDVPLGIYCEFFYNGADAVFDPEFLNLDEDILPLRRMKNASNFINMYMADAGLSPTRWQANTFPDPFCSEKISVIHEGIDTHSVVPARSAWIKLNNELVLRYNDEVITFVSRNLEPYRGYHIFMRALPAILHKCPNARVIIVGGESIGYGKPPPKGKTWKSVFVDEVRTRIDDADWKRVHFVNKIPYNIFIHLLQISSIHIYLSYPFVLSWSLLEAMSAGCAIVASDTEPVREVIEHNKTGKLFNFFDAKALANEVHALLNAPKERKRFGKAARAFICQNYDLKTICLPKQIEWVKKLVDSYRKDVKN